MSDDHKENEPLKESENSPNDPNIDNEHEVTETPQQSSSTENSDVWTEGPEVAQLSKDEKSIEEITNSDKEKGQGWQQDIINRLAFASLNEQRRARRWGIFFKILTFVYIGAILFYLPSEWKSKSIPGGSHTALVEVNGVIASDSEASADLIVTGLRAAFKDENTKGVILRINSPGGSPVQAGYVYDEVKRLREKHADIKVYAVIVDVCASGGYYIAAAADEIYADKASLVGSIGVLMNGFGFVGTMEKLGVERRLLTAGEHKAMMDPFSPVKKQDKQHMQNMLDGIHQQFINVVKEGRGEKLKDDPKLFSGMIWNGDQSINLGLVDALGSSSYVAREVIGEEKIVDFTPRSTYLDRFAERLGASFAKIMVNTLGINEPNSPLE